VCLQNAQCCKLKELKPESSSLLQRLGASVSGMYSDHP